ncbi:hypothetical protein [Prevotella sp. P6B1]|uniref:hypothetical protein n=1 Tax=Prevotella sp. P6B1 TaxID=1410613 RepID=UPI0012DD526E|nr:hypothetical protein [Prevotella sp. P6B1]
MTICKGLFGGIYETDIISTIIAIWSNVGLWSGEFIWHGARIGRILAELTRLMKRARSFYRLN